MAAPDAKTLPKIVTFSTAGLGGVAGWICVHPFNTIAVRMSLSKAEKVGMFQMTKQIVKKEGFLTLYKGLGAGVIRQVFYASSRFGLFEVFRDQLAKYRETDVWSRLVTGSLAGACAAFISCPGEVSLVRISNDLALESSKRRNYKSLLDAGLRIAREEGYRTFWRGSMPFVNRAMLVGAVQVGTLDQFKVTYAKLGLEGGYTNVLAASLSSGLLYALVTMPFETAKNRMAFQKTKLDLKYKTTLGTITGIATREGVLQLWAGFLPYYARCGIHTVVMFLTVDLMRNAYWAFKEPGASTTERE